MRIVQLDSDYAIVPETRIEMFLLWLLSFSVGVWVERYSKPYNRHLLIDGK